MKIMHSKDLAELCRDRRARAGMTQAEVGEQLDVSKASVWHAEHWSEDEHSMDVLRVRIANLLANGEEPLVLSHRAPIMEVVPFLEKHGLDCEEAAQAIGHYLCKRTQ